MAVPWAVRLIHQSVSDTRLSLIHELADGQCHSEAELAQHLGISRTTVWKNLCLLRDELALDITPVRGKGYCLIGGLELLDQERIQQALDPGIQDWITEWNIHDSLDSTNSWLMACARAGAPRGTLCLAEHQTAGRGRRGRHWVSPFGRNICLSLLWRYPFPISELGGLSLACGVAVARALVRLGVKGLTLKWPNDLLWDNRKLAGLLLEVGGEFHGPSFVVVGMGLNINLPVIAAANIGQPWVDLDAIPGLFTRRRNLILATLLSELVKALQQYESQRLRPFLIEWQQFDYFRKKEKVTLTLGSEQLDGDYLGITEQGSLCLRVEGKCFSYAVGEVSRCR